MQKTITKELLIIGAGLFSVEISGLVESSTKFKITAYVEGINKDRCKTKIGELPVIWMEDALKLENKTNCIAAIGSPKRKNIIEKFENKNFKFSQLIHHSAQILPSTTISNGSIIGAACVIAAECNIGKHVIINRGCLIGHHVKIANYVTVSPGANIAGKVEIKEGAYIGMGSIIIDGIKIGKNSIIGAGAVVTKDVPDNVQVFGAPARIIKKLK